MRTTRTTRILAAVTAALTSLVLLGTAAPADARRTVDATDFPGVRQVAKVLPDYVGGDRHIEADHAIWIFRADCSAYQDGPSGQVRSWAYFYGPDGSDPASLPRFHVQEFATKAAARKAIRTIRSNAEGCYGTHRHEENDATLIRRAADVPALGAGRPVAWKMNDHWTEQRDGLERSYYSRRIWMREGRTVIGVDLWGEVPQSRRASIRLARLVLRTVG